MSDAAPPETLPDADIEAMKRLADGDDLALNGIMHRWKDKVAAFLYRMTGSAEAAADLAQETFVRLYQSRARYQPAAAFPTYLFRIAANLGRNHARWRTRHPTVSVEDCTAAFQQLPGHDASPMRLPNSRKPRSASKRPSPACLSISGSAASLHLSGNESARDRSGSRLHDQSRRNTHLSGSTDAQRTAGGPTAELSEDCAVIGGNCFVQGIGRRGVDRS
jgi:RNA polymerase sigma factor (sigma-70 family)